jgi:uncharacterized membrane protein (UPF0136 family)
MPGGWLLVLSVFLFVWEPLRFADDLTGSLGTLAMRGTPGVVELAAHAATAIVAASAAWGLWVRNPRAPILASIAVAASSMVTIQSLYWTYLPGNVVPGEPLPLSILAIAHAAGWIAYLRKSRRVRIVYG